MEAQFYRLGPQQMPDGGLQATDTEGENHKKDKRHKDVVDLAPREVAIAVVELEENAGYEIIHRQAEGLQGIVQMRSEIVEKLMVNVVHHDEHDAQALHEVDISNALLLHLPSN